MDSSIVFTTHAMNRMNQRGIGQKMIDAILEYGIEQQQGKEEYLLYVPYSYVSKYNIPPQIAEKILDVGLVFSDNVLITVKHMYKKFLGKRVVCRGKSRRVL
ncbi:MAG TPA: DUF4258 domain-containing protein [bacterium]|nr:DUF4258 domain-containing protein [bacterium]